MQLLEFRIKFLLLQHSIKYISDARVVSIRTINNLYKIKSTNLIRNGYGSWFVFQ